MEFNRHSFIRYAVLGLLLVAFGSFDLFAATMWSGHISGDIFLGVIFAQMIVIAVWTGLGPANVFVRATSGLFLAMLVCLSVYGNMATHRFYRSSVGAQRRGTLALANLADSAVGKPHGVWLAAVLAG